MRKASTTSEARMWSAMAHPTTRRDDKSSTVARYSQPSQVHTYVLCAAAHNTYSAQLPVMCSTAFDAR